jgi:hypothetical protein
VNTDELESALMRAEIRVLKIQAKLHRFGRVRIILAALTTCTTLSAIRPSCWLAGIACVETRAPARSWRTSDTTRRDPPGLGRFSDRG